MASLSELDRRVRIWDASTANLLHVIDSVDPWALALGEPGRQPVIASASATSNELQLWNAHTGHDVALRTCWRSRAGGVLPSSSRSAPSARLVPDIGGT